MTKTYKLSTIQHVVEIGTKLSRSWFRGHSKIFGELTPGIFRKGYDSPLRSRRDIEFDLITKFKLNAPSLESNLPDYNDHVSWLFLMQHHGLPTRLLDWSESILIALYFVVIENKSDDGELWAMYPDALNERSGFFGIALPNSRKLRYLASKPVRNNPEELKEELKLKEIPKYPLAIQPSMNFSRMVSQLSVFTIHPEPLPNCTIPDLLQEKENIVRYIIPANSKGELLRDLAALGITPRTLRPDLDSLSATLKQESRIGAYGPPAPPPCDGEWDDEVEI